VRKPEEEHLFGTTVALGGYWHNNRCHLIGLQWPDGIRVVNWEPKWSASDPDAGTEQALSDKEMGFIEEGSFEEQQQWAKDAAHFALSMSLLLEAYESPLEVKREDGPKGGARKPGQPLKSGDWITNHVYLTIEPKPRKLTAEHIPPKPNKDAIAETIIVRPYLRRQRFGPRLQEIRWIWISAHEAIRWRSTKPKRTVIH
jgi:hypothetical protein